MLFPVYEDTSNLCNNYVYAIKWISEMLSRYRLLFWNRSITGGGGESFSKKSFHQKSFSQNHLVKCVISSKIIWSNASFHPKSFYQMVISSQAVWELFRWQGVRTPFRTCFLRWTGRGRSCVLFEVDRGGGGCVLFCTRFRTKHHIGLLWAQKSAWCVRVWGEVRLRFFSRL